ncbi:MAG: hypothetical protein AAF360_12430 [Pseudomonadota bacterium]
MEHLDMTFFAVLAAAGLIAYVVSTYFSRLALRYQRAPSPERIEDLIALIEQIPADELARIEAAIAKKRKLEAIKILHQATHVSLRDAKDAVEHLIEAER